MERWKSDLSGRSQAGFSLIELLIVIGLVAVISAMATASFAGRHEERSLESFLSDLKAYVRFVQYRAVEKGQTYRIDIGENGELSSMVDESGKGNFVEAGDTLALRLNRFKSFRLSFDDTDGIYFFPDGVASHNRVFVSRGLDRLATIEVSSRVGQIRVELPKGQ